MYDLVVSRVLCAQGLTRGTANLVSEEAFLRQMDVVQGIRSRRGT